MFVERRPGGIGMEMDSLKYMIKGRKHKRRMNSKNVSYFVRYKVTKQRTEGKYLHCK